MKKNLLFILITLIAFKDYAQGNMSNNMTPVTVPVPIPTLTAFKSLTNFSPTLRSPANGEIIGEGIMPRFSWSVPKTISNNLRYRIKIVEIIGDQSPENAIKANKPFFEKDSIPPMLRGNKPHFERDSIPSSLRGNKPHFEKDSIKAFRGNKPHFERDSIEALRGNKPLFERDSIEALRGNKPHFEKDSIKAFRGNKPHFERDSIEALRGNKPHFERDSIEALRGNKSFSEKDKLEQINFEYPASGPRFIKGKQYAWTVQVLNSKGKPVGRNKGLNNPNVFIVSN